MKKKIKSNRAHGLLPIAAALIVLLLFRTVFLLGYVPTASMEPTLKAGSLVLGNRLDRRFEVGDVVIFQHDGQLLVKRIAAVEGDIVTHKGVGIAVPAGTCYVLGDNAEDSYDSRYWDEPFVPESAIVAKVWLP